jgi:hypothetical protein
MITTRFGMVKVQMLDTKRAAIMWCSQDLEMQGKSVRAFATDTMSGEFIIHWHVQVVSIFRLTMLLLAK